MTTATKYIGVKMVEAVPEIRNSVAGYALTYPDGYKSWSPADVFESAYMPMVDWQFPKVTANMTPDEHIAGTKMVAAKGDEVTLAMVSEFLGDKIILKEDAKEGSAKIKASAMLPNGIWIESEFDREPDMSAEDQIVRGREKLRSVIWPFLNFLVRWALNGIKKKGGRPKTPKPGVPMWAAEPGSAPKPKTPKAPKAPPAPKPEKVKTPKAPKAPKAPKTATETPKPKRKKATA